MKIAFVLDSWPRLSETFVVREIAAVAERHKVRIVALEDSGEAAADPETEALAKGRLAVVSALPASFGAFLLSGAGHPIRAARAFAAARRARAESGMARLPALASEAAILHEWGVERIHAHFARWATSAAEVLSAWTGAPFGFTAHAYDVFAEPVRLADKVRRARWVVACSTAARDEIARRCGEAAGAKVRVIRHGVDLARYRPPERERAAGPLRILCVGRLVPKKGFDVLVEALSILKRGGIAAEARVLGEGEARSDWEAAGRAAGVADLVRWEGATAPDRVLDAYRSWADVLAAPSRVTPEGDRDGIPNVVGEAMACGLPVVGTPVGGIPELVADGETGIVVPPDSPQALADALAGLSADAALRARLGRAGRAKAESVFDARKNVLEWLALVESAGAEGRRD